MRDQYSVKDYSTTNRIYKNFCEAIRRRGIQANGVYASFYFDAFFLNDFQIKKEIVVQKGLCSDDPGAFGDWRKEQKKLGLLDWVEKKSSDGTPRGVEYKPGKIALSYINKLTLESRQIATKDDISGLGDKIVGLEARVDRLESALGRIIHKKDPPVTDEKIEYYTSNPEELLM